MDITVPVTINYPGHSVPNAFTPSGTIDIPGAIVVATATLHIDDNTKVELATLFGTPTTALLTATQLAATYPLAELFAAAQIAASK